MKRWGLKIISMMMVSAFLLGLKAEVMRVSSVKQFDRLRRHNKMMVVYFYTHNTLQGKLSENFKILQHQIQRFYRVSERARYKDVGVKFVLVNLMQADLVQLKERYNLTSPDTLLLFYRKSLYSDDRLEGAEWTRADLEDFIDDHFTAFIKENLERKEQRAIYNPMRNTIYEFGRPIVYAGPTWGYYYSPTAWDPYWYPCSWYGCGPRFGFGFSIGI